MITTRTGIDHTDGMNAWSDRRLEELAGEDLCGYVLKKDSPSCGMERVKVFGTAGMPERQGRGLFAAALCSSGFQAFRSRKKAGCRIHGCVRTSSSECSPIGG